MIKTDDDTTIRLQLWVLEFNIIYLFLWFSFKDIGGQERFGNLTRIYYKDAVGCIVVYDVSRPTTFDAVSKWKSDLDSKIQLPDGSPLPCILLANKVFSV
jgi:Ras-related protein Rab-32